MSEFKFSCPVCGQNIVCDMALEGTQHICPHCSNIIGVPTEFAEPAEVSTGTDTPPPWTGYNATATQRTSGLAIASLVCSLSSVITCIGWLPGIICGHLAKSRIRRNSSLKGSRLATAGLAIGYLILMLEAGTAAVHMARFSATMKQGLDNVRQNLATNNVIIAQTQSTTVSNHDQPMEPAAPVVVATTSARQTEPANSEWTLDISHVSFPDHPASGKLHGFDFNFKTATFKNGIVRINSANGTSLDIFHGLAASSIEGKSFEIQSTDDSSANLHVRMNWTEDEVVQSQSFGKGYALKLQFGHAINRTVTAKIYLCFPDDAKSYLAGTFKVRLPQPKRQPRPNEN